jgi:hypothetical protein
VPAVVTATGVGFWISELFPSWPLESSPHRKW